MKIAKFKTWLEHRDPDLHHQLLNEVNWLSILNKMGIGSGVAVNLLALAHSLYGR